MTVSACYANLVRKTKLKNREKYAYMRRDPTGYILNCIIRFLQGGACGVMVIVAGYGHGDTSSNPGPD